MARGGNREPEQGSEKVEAQEINFETVAKIPFSLSEIPSFKTHSTLYAKTLIYSGKCLGIDAEVFSGQKRKRLKNGIIFEQVIVVGVDGKAYEINPKDIAMAVHCTLKAHKKELSGIEE